MNEKRLITYLNKKCIIILQNRLKYEGIIKEIYKDSFLIQDKLGDYVEINNDSVSLIIDKEIKNE